MEKIVLLSKFFIVPIYDRNKNTTVLYEGVKAMEELEIKVMQEVLHEEI